MPSIEELLGIKKPAAPVVAVKKQKQVVIAEKKSAAIVPSSIKYAATVKPAPESIIISTPKSLAEALSQGKKVLAESRAKSAVETKQQNIVDSIPMQQATPANAPNAVPTLQDVSDFVFEEQDEDFDMDDAENLLLYMQQLEAATGTDIPRNLTKCLKFLQANASLVDILKPEHIAILVTGARKSYGFVVQNKTERSQKKAENSKKVDKILDTMSGLDF